jgi:hypothetical protein
LNGCEWKVRYWKRKRISGILTVAYFLLMGHNYSGILVTWMGEVADLMTDGRLGLAREA